MPTKERPIGSSAPKDSRQELIDIGVIDDKKEKQWLDQYGEDKASVLQHIKDLQSEWESVFGNIQDNVSNYYNDLDATKLANAVGADLDKQYDIIDKNRKAEITRRGLKGSAIDMFTKQQLEVDKANKKTTAKNITIPENVNQQQLGFLSLGLNKKDQIDATKTNVLSGNQGQNLYLYTRQQDKNVLGSNSLLKLRREKEAAAGKLAANYFLEGKDAALAAVTGGLSAAAGG